jgi:transcriptional regulator with XRE-family HTH domain
MPETNGAPWSLTLNEVGARLQELREARDLTLAAVAQLLHERGVKTDASALSRVEGGKRRTVSRELVDALFAIYEADSQTRDEVVGLLAVETTPGGRQRRPALWRRHAGLLGPMAFESYLKLEPRASLIRNYEPALVPGLLQTSDYASHVIAGIRAELTPAEVRGLVDVRMDRQRKLANGALQGFQALIESAALRRMVGGRDIMRAQVRHLLEASEEPRNSVRVLPEKIGCHPGLAGAFVLMSFPEAARDIVWIETMTRSVYVEDEEDVARYSEAFGGLWERALDAEATRAHLGQVIKEL